MPVLAHVPADVGVEHAIRSGAEIQHNGNVMAFVARDYVRGPGANYLDSFDLSEADRKLPDLATLMLESGVAFTPTMIGDVAAFELFDHLPDWGRAPMFQRPEYRYVPPAYLAQWTDTTGGEIAVVVRDAPIATRARDAGQLAAQALQDADLTAHRGGEIKARVIKVAPRRRQQALIDRILA